MNTKLNIIHQITKKKHNNKKKQANNKHNRRHNEPLSISQIPRDFSKAHTSAQSAPMLKIFHTFFRKGHAFGLGEKRPYDAFISRLFSRKFAEAALILT